MKNVLLPILLTFSLLASLLPQEAVSQTPLPNKRLGHSTHARSLLVFSKTTGVRHPSITDGLAAINQLGREHHFEVEATQDASAFTEDRLARYDAVVFLNTTGDVLNEDQQKAFEQYIQGGGGFAGIHAAAETEPSWNWYGGLVGTRPSDRSPVQEATVKVADPVHPSTASLPKRWRRKDKWYSFRPNPRGNVHVLATVEGNAVLGSEQGHDHPIAWCQPYNQGRAWYTAGGHTPASFSDPSFQQHLLGGLEYAAGIKQGNCSASLEANFEKVVLNDNTLNPMDLEVAPDGRVFFVQLEGTIEIYDPETARTVVAGELDVFRAFEDGLVGLALDPHFEENHWIYLFYAPAGETPKQHVSRFTVRGNTLDMQSEKVLLEIPTQRKECCHTGGALEFGPEGNLFIAVGDNTNPFESDSYAPIDERPGRAIWDAQRTAGNTNDLRGKILRIRPQPDGTYVIPEGNLFAEGNPKTRPEIYVMGVRNPFRMSIDPATGWLYWGDVGPDGARADPERGPEALDEWNRTRKAGNFGWPYCIGNNKPYMDYNFATGTSGDPFNCAAPVNDSPNNTGLQQLPPVRKAWIWYPYGRSEAFPQIDGSGGRTAMAGPVYHYTPNPDAKKKLPAYYDKTLFIYEWSRDWIKELKFDAEGNILKVNPFLPNMELAAPIDMEIGPNGALYLIEWGSDRFSRSNTDSQVIRINYVEGARAPIAQASADSTMGPVPLPIQFRGDQSLDPDSEGELDFSWTFKADGQVQSTDPNPRFTYTEPGNYTAQLTVADAEGNRSFSNVPVTAGNSRPRVSLEQPVQGGFFEWGASVPYKLRVHDREDGNTDQEGIPCQNVTVQPAIGHNAHSHGEERYTGCAGTFEAATGHGSGGDDIFYVLEALYTDRGGKNVRSLTGRTVRVLQPKRKEAEHFTSSSGIALEDTQDPNGGGKDVRFIGHGDYVSYRPMNLKNIYTLTYRIASPKPGSRIEVHVDSTTGPLLSTVTVPPPASSPSSYIDVTTPVENPGGVHELYFVFRRNDGDDQLMQINWITFRGEGVSLPAPPPGDPSDRVRLHRPSPNPFAAETKIRFSLREAMKIRLEVFDLLGRRVTTLAEGYRQVGTHTVNVDGHVLASGLYVYRLSTPARTISRKMIVVK